MNYTEANELIFFSYRFKNAMVVTKAAKALTWGVVFVLNAFFVLSILFM